jgi:hypothetical protein
MTRYDVFNGDADGICALVQLRLASPGPSVLVTGAKRDIALLSRVEARAGDAVTVLDVSADVNREALAALLERGASVDYFDHHRADTLPRHPRLHARIDTSASTCTSLIVDRHLDGAHRAWAVVGAYGDNLAGPARAHADALGLSDEQAHRLRELGELLAYNAYGDDEADLVVPPAQLYRAVYAARDPFAFLREAPECREIARQKELDAGFAALAQPHVALAGAVVYVLPDQPWSRRVRGLLANDLANRFPHLAHAVLTPDAAGGYTVSVRAPLDRPSGADRLCGAFPGGGGRVAAAGINHLPRSDLQRFVAALDAAFPRAA